MEDSRFNHVKTFCLGLELSVVPFHSEALLGIDWTTGATCDCKVEPANVRNCTCHFEAWALEMHGVNMTFLPPKNQPLPGRWFGSEIFKYLHEYLVKYLPSGRSDTGPEQAWFNTWHCWIHQMFEKFFPLLKRFQEPTLELHLLISNQRVKTDQRCNGGKRRPTNQANPRAKRSKSR
jgi:hypothetical protein